MAKKLTEQKKKQIYEEIREILSDELATALDEIGPKTKIIEDLGGDSLLYFDHFRAAADNQRAIGTVFCTPVMVLDCPVNGRFDLIRI